MKPVLKRPQQRKIVLSIAAALVTLASSAAQADCVLGGIVAASTNGNINWSSGNCTINSGVTVSNFYQQTAIVSSASAGTLTNSGTLGGIQYGMRNDGTLGLVDNRSGGVIVGGNTSGAGLSNNGLIGSLSNSGTISSGSEGLVNAGTIGTLTNSGGIIGSGGIGFTVFRGVDNRGSITRLDNVAGGTISGGSQGLFNSGTISTLNNSGLITSANGSSLQGITNSGAGTIAVLNNNSGGTISAYSALSNTGTIGTLANSGVIKGSLYGVANSSQINSIVNNNGGTISGSTGIANRTATIQSLVNSGVLTGNIRAIYNLSGSQIGSLTNNSTISAGGSGILNSGTITLLSNNSGGMITGNLNAVSITGTGTIGIFSNAGVVAGNIVNQSATDLNIAGGAGTVFGTLTGLIGFMGTITNTLSNINLLSGNQLLNSNVAVGAFALNNTAGTLALNNTVTITGNYTQGAGAVLLVGVANGATATGAASDTGYGRLVVSGAATVASGSSIALQKLNSYAFAAGQRFVVIDALTAGTNYNASTLNYSAAGATGLTASGAVVVNGANSNLVVSLSGSPGPTPASGATAPNAVSALNGLFSYTGVADAGLLNLYNAARALNAGGSAGDLNRAGKQFAPNTQVSSGYAAVASTNAVLNIINRHTDGVRLSQGQGSGLATGEAPSQFGAWGQVFDGQATQSQRDQVDGFRANYYGLLFGLDRMVSDSWRAGGVFSYSTATADNSGDTSGNNTKIDSWGLFGYGAYVAGDWYANVAAGMVQQHYDTRRVINFSGFSGNAAGRFDCQQYVLRGEVGYPIRAGDYTVTPLAGLAYSYLRQDGYTESGGNGAALSVNASRTNAMTSDIGAKFAREFSTSYGVVIPELRLAWRHEYRNDRARSTANFAGDPTGATSFTTLGASPVKDSALVSVGMTLVKSSDLSLDVRYDGQTGGGFQSNTGSVRLRKSF